MSSQCTQKKDSQQCFTFTYLLSLNTQGYTIPFVQGSDIKEPFDYDLICLEKRLNQNLALKMKD